jgi:hypothetical protein
MGLDATAVFVTASRAGGSIAAARQLGLPAFTVGARVARLEKRLGVTLLRRAVEVGVCCGADFSRPLRPAEAGPTGAARRRGRGLLWGRLQSAAASG